MQKKLFWLWVAFILPATAAELKFDFADYPTGETPTGFRSVVAGSGNPGEWKVIMDEVPPTLAPLTPDATPVTKRAVLAQLSREAINDHYPILMYDKETFGDFKLRTKFKTVGGGLEQMAGIVFRMQDERNFYVIRASSLYSNFRFYKVVNGGLTAPVGPSMEIPSGIWHEMTIECKGTSIRWSVDGKELPPLNDPTFTTGKIGFWTKSDAVSYFYDTQITYRPRIVPAQGLVDDALEKYTRLLGLKVYAKNRDTNTVRLIASSNKNEIGQLGGEQEENVLKNGAVYCGFGKESVGVILPLRDQNGDPVAAVQVTMKTFRGQTEQNAIVRATIVLKYMQEKVRTLDDVVQ